MNEIQYVGENLLPGQIGHLSVILSFVGGLMAAVAYFFATNNRNDDSYDSWRNLGRIAFGVHGLSVFVIIGTIFYLKIQVTWIDLYYLNILMVKIHKCNFWKIGRMKLHHSIAWPTDPSKDQSRRH